MKPVDCLAPAGIAQAHLAQIQRELPGVWAHVDQYRASVLGTAGTHWLDRCFMPEQDMLALVTRIMPFATRHDALSKAARLAVLAPWRVSQGVFTFDKSVALALAATPLETALPTDVLLALPRQWCMLLDVRNTALAAAPTPVSGVFVRFECSDDALINLHLSLIDPAGALTVLRLPLTPGARIGPCINAAPQALRSQLETISGLLLYLCTTDALLGADAPEPDYPRPKRTKQGWRLFAPKKPVIWKAGRSMGDALRSRGIIKDDQVREGLRPGCWQVLPGAGKGASMNWTPPLPGHTTRLQDVLIPKRPMM